MYKSKMSTQRLNAAEKDLEKFIKFLALKSTQVVVQSRLGEKIQTQCNPLATGNDWFNIVVQDHPDICAETKRALALAAGDSILQRFPLCVEISLKTVEGDQMVLEVWSMDVQSPHQKDKLADDKADKIDATTNNTNNTTTTATNNSTAGSNNSGNDQQQTLKAAHAIYNRMGVLLKSLISLTRATPAYKLSRRQCADSYGIYYRIYCDRPQVHTLGDGHKNVKIGQLNTIVGTLSMSVSYRTKMTITPTAQAGRTAEGNAIMLDSNYFRPAEANGGCGAATMAAGAVATPTHTQKKAMHGASGLGVGAAGGGGGGGGCSADDRKVIDIEKPLRPGAFTDVGKLRQYTEEDFVLPETPPFEWLLRRTRHESGGSRGSLESLNRKCDSPTVASPPQYEGASHCNNNNNNNNNNANMLNNNNHHHHHNNNNNLAAFKSLEHDDSAAKSAPSTNALFVPAATRMMMKQSPGNSPTQSPSSPTSDTSLAAQLDDDNLLKELNFPFASTTSHVNDLAKFYRDCYHAPPLKGLSELQSDTVVGCGATATYAADSTAAAAAVDDLSRQLEQFETSLEDYDKLVSQLGLSASSSTGSRSSGGLQMSN